MITVKGVCWMQPSVIIYCFWKTSRVWKSCDSASVVKHWWYKGAAQQQLIFELCCRLFMVSLWQQLEDWKQGLDKLKHLVYTDLVQTCREKFMRRSWVSRTFIYLWWFVDVVNRIIFWSFDQWFLVGLIFHNESTSQSSTTDSYKTAQ